MNTNAAIPATMQAVQLDQPGRELALREIPVPHPQAGQVLIHMAAAPINPSDLGALSGLSYRGERKFPFTPGLEGSGTVVASGRGLPAAPVERSAGGMLGAGGQWELGRIYAHFCAVMRSAE